jgi:hypothetical protein
VHATSHYLAEALPQLDMFSVEYSEYRQLRIFRLVFVEADSEFIRAVVVPKISELLSEFSGGLGDTHVSPGFYAFYWNIRQVFTALELRRILGLNYIPEIDDGGPKFCFPGETTLRTRESADALLKAGCQ